MIETTARPLKQIPAVPQQGEIYLSVNLGLVRDTGLFWELADRLNLQAKLCSLHRAGDIEIHALLLYEHRPCEFHLDQNEFAPLINTLVETLGCSEAIRFVYSLNESDRVLLASV